jgi:hypothetical protein
LLPVRLTRGRHADQERGRRALARRAELINSR